MSAGPSWAGTLGTLIGLGLFVQLLNTILIFNFLPHRQGFRKLLGPQLSTRDPMDFDVVWIGDASSFKRRAGSRTWEEWVGGHSTFHFEQQSPEPLLFDASRKISVRLTSTTCFHRNGTEGDWLVLGRGEFQENSEQKLLTQMLWTSPNSNFSRPNGSAHWFEMQGEVKQFEFEVSSWEGSKSVLLLDPSRNIAVKLDEFSANYRYSSADDWSPLSSGEWTIFDGIPFPKDGDVSGARPPPPMFNTSDFATVTIFIGLAAYREGLCGNTLKELFEFARYPDRVSVGVVQQNGAGDPDCLQDYCTTVSNCRRSQVQVITVPLSHSRQVMPARFRQHLLLNHQDFCLQVDSHSAFEKDWDLLALQTWLDCDNEMAVLTAYPNTVGSRHDQRFTPNRCSTQFSGEGLEQIVHGGNSAMNVPPHSKPNLIPFFGAGIGFARCHASLNVPYDPYLPFLMGGEEFNTAARLWTWGYDLYAPSRNFVYHYYNDEHLPDELSAKRRRSKSAFSPSDPAAEAQLRIETVKRWRALFGLPLVGAPRPHTLDDLRYFGLGQRRTLANYLDFAGVDLAAGKLTSRCDMLGRMKWRPYDYETPFRPSGPACGDPYGCCTNLAQIKARAEAMLNKTATELFAAASRDVQDDSVDWSRARSPVLSPFASQVCT